MAAIATKQDDHKRAWGRFARLLVGSACALFVLVMGFLLAVDPYDSGRTGILGRAGVPHQAATTANASRARDPAFNAAVFGNSHVQQLNPIRLNERTGLAFVSLTIPATGPADHLAVLKRFLATRPSSPRAIVIGADFTWCRPTMAFEPRFPAWLYDPSLLTYVTGLARYRSVEAAISRLAFLATGRGGARPDGYWDYSPLYTRMGLADPEASRKRILEDRTQVFAATPSAQFPAFESLQAVLRDLSHETNVVLVRPPVYQSALPQPGTQPDDTQRECRKAIEDVVAQFPNVRMIDLLSRGPITEDVANFYDLTHYRDTVAVTIERMIAEQLKRQQLAGTTSPN